MSKTKFDCNICCDEVGVKNKVSCKCGFDTCKDCAKRYLLGQTKDAHCMNCKVGWGMKFLITNFTKTWVQGNKKGQWRHHQKEVTLDREKSRIPETLAELPRIRAQERAIAEANKVVDDLLDRRKYLQNKINKLKSKEKETVVPKPYTKTITNFPDKCGITEEKARVLLGYRKCEIPEGMYIRTTNAQNLLFKPGKSHANWVKAGIYMGPAKHTKVLEWLEKKGGTPKRVPNKQQQLSKAKNELYEIKFLLADAWRQAYNAKGKDDPSLRTPNFICPCPYDNCKGMIGSKKFTCVKCDKKVCKRCREPRKKKHKCDPQVIESVKFLKKDTKPCPTCAVPIHKYEGCDQCWCTTCRTAFSWRTGELETGVIHNPHAIEWQRKHGKLERDLNDIPCGGLVQLTMIKNIPKLLEKKIQRIHSVIAEIDYKILRPTNNFSDLRLHYVRDVIDEDEWRQSIFLRERENARRKASADILVTLRTLGVERFRDLAESQQFTNFLEEMEEIRVFINQAFQDELPYLGTKHPLQIMDTWIWSDKYARDKKRRERDPTYKL